MITSAAMMVKSYFEKFIVVNLVRTKQRKYSDPTLASSTLSAAFDIVNEMNELIRSNNANDLKAVKYCLRKQVGVIRHEMKDRQTFFQMVFHEVRLPEDFDTCIHTAWYKLRDFERLNAEDQPMRTAKLT